MKGTRFHQNSDYLPGMENMGRIDLDKTTLDAIDKLEANAKYPTGIGKIYRGECKLGATSPNACMLCLMGHMLECHYPQTCMQAQCSHLREEE